MEVLLILMHKPWPFLGWVFFVLVGSSLFAAAVLIIAINLYHWGRILLGLAVRKIKEMYG